MSRRKVEPAGTPRGAQASGRPVLEPEVLPPESRWIERIAWLMDRSIPLGRRWSVGLDAIIGLVPGVGDIAGILVGAAIVGAAIKARLPRSAIARMVANVAVDGLFGAVPFLGDVFDMVFKANTRNVEIFREAVRGRYEPVRDSSFAAGVAIAFLLILAVPILLIVLLIRAFGLL